MGHMEPSNSLTEQEHIAIMAHRIYVEEGRQEGKAAEHWARAERAVREQRVPVPSATEANETEQA